MFARLSILLLLVFALHASAQSAQPATLRSTLVDGLRASHNKAEWFVPVGTAVEGLTPGQAKWVPRNARGKINPDANHSVGMLTYHLWFWDARALARFKQEPLPQAPGNNDETFNDFNAKIWAQTVVNLDRVIKSLEDLVLQASDAQLAAWAPTLRDIAEHNAYHTGQILYVRKLQGSWSAAKGVK